MLKSKSCLSKKARISRYGCPREVHRHGVLHQHLISSRLTWSGSIFRIKTPNQPTVQGSAQAKLLTEVSQTVINSHEKKITGKKRCSHKLLSPEPETFRQGLEDITSVSVVVRVWSCRAISKARTAVNRYIQHATVTWKRMPPIIQQTLVTVKRKLVQRKNEGTHHDN